MPRRSQPNPLRSARPQGARRVPGTGIKMLAGRLGDAVPTVLVAEDNEPLRENMLEVLSLAGYEATGAENGARALELLRELEPKPDVIVLDLMMPEMSGWRFREAQLADPLLASIPVVVMSQLHDHQRDFPDVSFLPKP